MATDILDGLRDRSAYPEAVGEIEVRQTHASMLFFAGQRVYKVKKPVDFGFLDFSTLEKRKQACEDEVRLNRRLAPDTYLGVLPITRRGGGGLQLGGDGEAIDYAVEMVRLPAHRMLDRLLDSGEIDNKLLADLCGLLVLFHERAARGRDVSRHGTYEAVRRLVLDNLSELHRCAADDDALVSPRLHAFLEQRTRDFLTSHKELFDRRVRLGFIREGHGDLHAANICDTRDGLVAYDCIEFNPCLRCADVANDIAFLAMDLDHRGFRAHARYLVQEYAVATRDLVLEWLVDFYKTYRALVRAKVAALLAADPGIAPDDRDDARRQVGSYARLAASYELAPSLVLMCGLPGTGKSWLARRIADTLGATVLRSDTIRKIEAGLPPTAHVDGDAAADLYGASRTADVYHSLCERAIGSLARGRGVVVDATFAALSHRRRFLDAATRLGHPVAVVHVACSEEVVRERLAGRAGDPHEVSDADWTVYEAVRDRFEAPDELADTHRIDYASGDAPERALDDVVDRLVAQTETKPVHYRLD